MTNHMKNPPQLPGVTFKLKHGHYHLNKSYGQIDLRSVSNAEISAKIHLCAKDEVRVWNYLASAERCTTQEARRAYEDVLQKS